MYIDKGRASLKVSGRVLPWAQTGTIDIEILLQWVYRDQEAHRLVGWGLGLHEIEAEISGVQRTRRSGDGVQAMIERADLGCAIDYSGADEGACHHVALQVHEFNHLQEPALSRLLIKHAVAANRPDWRVQDRFEPVAWKPGLRGVEAEEEMNWCHLVRHYIWSCRIFRADGPETRALKRALYREWWVSCRTLQKMLAPRLRDFTVTGPAARVSPWL